MQKSRSLFTLVLSITIGLLLVSMLGLVQPTSVVYAEGSGTGDPCDEDTCPPDTEEVSLAIAPDGSTVDIVSVLFGWLFH